MPALTRCGRSAASRRMPGSSRGGCEPCHPGGIPAAGSRQGRSSHEQPPRRHWPPTSPSSGSPTPSAPAPAATPPRPPRRPHRSRRRDPAADRPPRTCPCPPVAPGVEQARGGCPHRRRSSRATGSTAASGAAAWASSTARPTCRSTAPWRSRCSTTSSQGPDFRRRFVTESKLAASLDHPNVIPIYAAGERDGMPYIAMRFVPGEDLRAVSARGRAARARARRPDRRAARVRARRRARGGPRAPRRQARQRAGDATDDHVYLTDFGLTKRIAPTAEATKTAWCSARSTTWRPSRSAGRRSGRSRTSTRSAA